MLLNIQQPKYNKQNELYNLTQFHCKERFGSKTSRFLSRNIPTYIYYMCLPSLHHEIASIIFFS